MTTAEADKTFSHNESHVIENTMVDNVTATGKRFNLAKCTNLVRPFMQSTEEMTIDIDHNYMDQTNPLI